MSNGDTGVCWCASGDSKCPHHINTRINGLWNEMEAAVDEVLEQFDRRSIKRYLSKDSKPSQTEKFKQVYGASNGEFAEKVVKGTAEMRESKTSQGARHPLKHMSERPGTAPNQNNTGGAKSGKKGQGQGRKPLDPGMSKPHALAEGEIYGSITTDAKGFARDKSGGGMSVSKSTTALPPVSGAAAAMYGDGTPVMKQLDLRVDPADDEGSLTGKSGGKDMKRSMRQTNVGDGPEEGAVGVAVDGEVAISMGLLRIADRLSRMVLPWQAQCCPRAVEQTRDYRMSVIQGKHSEFVLRMKKQLENKVVNFLAKKDEEVDFWMQKEIKVWMDAMHKQEADQSNFFQDDIERISTRVNAQEAAAKERELRLAHELDDKERDNTRDQLVKFRRLCRAKDKMQNADTRALYASFENAQGKVSANETLHTREVAKSVETAHDWLCCLADNAITAASSEGMLSGMFTTLDKERERAITSLKSAMDAYKQQHNAILDAIVQFSARIHRHASDYLSREHLISKAFLQYLLSVISGEIKPHTSDVRRSSIAWEGKFVSDRAHKMDQTMNKEFNLSLMPFDKLVGDLRERMVRQLDNVTVKMQGILNGREQDINRRKAQLHKKLAVHVNKACNARRRRLKSNVKLEKVEAALEEKALSSINDMSAELRTAVDQIWVKEHLRERRMYEAATGRMERLKKSALVIWKKHSHLALGQKEDYADWLALYRQDRDNNSSERRHTMMKDWEEWRAEYGKTTKKVSIKFKPWFRKYLNRAVEYDANVPIDQNVKDLTLSTGNVLSAIKQAISSLRREAQEYVTREMKISDDYFVERRRLLIEEWQDNLFRLNDAVNRRVGKLKDTEGDLEETLRLTLAQHEIEAVVFEQSSCARLENFWLNSREKINALGKELMDSQADIAMAKTSGGGVAKKSRNDREIDGILDMPAETSKPGQKHSSSGGHTGKGGSKASESTAGNKGGGGSKHQFCDTFSMKRLLDEVRTDLYRDFAHKLLKAFEVAKKRRGVGKKRYLPAFLAAQTLFRLVLDFWDGAKFTEKLVGRMKFKGEVLFKDGLPLHARPSFVIAACVSLISECTFKGRTTTGGNGLLDCDDILELVDKGPKRFFLTGLIHICIEVGSFGENQLRNECMWACTSCAIAPPVELFEGRENQILGKDWDKQAKQAGDAYGGGAASESAAQHALKAGIPGAVNFAHHTGGFFMEDPVDLLNSILFLDRHDEDGLDAYYEPDPAGRDSKYKDAEKLVGIDELFPFISSVFPATDLMVFAALLGRPDQQFELTTHRFCQAVISWRRIALSITLAVSDSPGADYPRVQDLITQHSISRTGKRKSGYANIACASPFEAVAAVLDWMTSISRVPVSVLQGFCLFTRGGSCDPWLEDPKQSRRGDRFLYELSEWVQIMMHSADFASDEAAFPAVLDILLRDDLAKFDLQGDGIIPAELLRSYVKREDPDLSNLQVTATFWSLNRGRGMEGDMLDLATYLHAEPAPLQIEPAVEEGVVEEKEDGLAPIISNLDPSHFDDLADAQSKAVDSQTEGGQSQYLDRYESNTMASNRPKPIETVFNGSSEEYMKRFRYDVDAYLSAAPSMDANVVLGMLPAALNPSAAHELLSDAMRLDPSAKNNIPSSVCVWIGARNMVCDAAIKQVTLERNPKWDEGPNHDWRDPDKEQETVSKTFLPLGARNLPHEDDDTPIKTPEEQERLQSEVDAIEAAKTPESPATKRARTGQDEKEEEPPMHARLLRHLLEVRMRVEMDYIIKYPQICEQRNSDEHYGAAGGAPLDGENHWEEAFGRRLARVDKLTAAWRDTMMTEWGNSLYQSRQDRYEHRVHVVRECVSVYHSQYEELKGSIVAERAELLQQYKQLELELKDIVREDSGFVSYHGSFIERQLRNLEGVFHRAMNIYHGALEKFQQHCGAVKRRGLERVRESKQRMKESMERSCTGLIVGYTGGFAQGAFDELMYRGEHWRKGVTEMHGNLIFEKEAFVHAKEEAERDLAMQISDRITLDRARTKGLLDGLAEDSASLQEVISNTRASYASIQKDANSRLLIRIEKALRESRKLRAAAEDQPELEPAVLREIRVILDQAKTSCDSIVGQIKSTSEGQLRAIEPMRNPHREKMEDKIGTLEVGWKEVEELLLPLVTTYEKQMGTKLGMLKANCSEGVGEYRENETRALEREFKRERRALVQAFREHFTTYDLSEASIFEKFNYEVQDAVFEMKNMWGPNRPQFIAQASNDVSDLAHGAIKRACIDVKATAFEHASSTDDSILARQELADMLCHGLLDLHESVETMQTKFEEDKVKTLTEVESMKMDETGDIVRPQVTAVVDLLCSAIEIDVDFSKGYETLIKSTGERSEEALTELSDFMKRFETDGVDGSLPQAVNSLRSRVTRRKEEVQSVIDAANSHVVADNTRIEVVLQAGYKDIGEWETLTKQLVENAFFNAEKNLMSSLFATPPASPRREDELPPDEDRVARIKELLKKTHEPADFDHEMDMEKTQRRNNKRREARAIHDPTPLMPQNGTNMAGAKLNLNAVTDPSKTKELQAGWLECYTSEGYTYFYNPGTGESLWDLPAAMKVPLYDDDEVRVIETPRDLVTGEFFDPNHDERDETDLKKKADAAGLRGLGDNTSSTYVKDKRVIMADIAENALAFAVGGLDTAVDVTSVLKGVKRAKRLDFPKRKAEDEKEDEEEGATIGASTYVTSHGEETQADGGEVDRYNDASKLKHPPPPAAEAAAAAGGTAMGTGLLEEKEDDPSVAADAAAAAIEKELDEGDNASVVTQELMIQQGAFMEALDDGEMAFDTEDGGGNQDNLLAMGLLGSEEEMSVQLMIAEEEGKAAAEQAYKEARECDTMYKEEMASEEVEADYERRLRDVFHNKMMKCVDGAGTTNSQVDELKLLARGLKRISVIEEFADNGVSWDKLQEKVFQTLAAEEEVRLLGERLKTEQGRDRQKKIMEHQEDIEEMTDFFRKECNLSRTNARKAATECVMRNICTQKKLAKVWVRGDMDLEKDLQLDEDDAEDVALALKSVHDAQQSKVALNASMASMSMTVGSEANAFTTMGVDQSFYTQQQQQDQAYDPYATGQQQQQQQQQQQGQDYTQYDENGYPIDPNATGQEGYYDQTAAGSGGDGYDQTGYEDPNAGYYDQSQQQQQGEQGQDYTQYDENGYPIDPNATGQEGYYDQTAAVTGAAAGGGDASGLPEGWYEAYTDEGHLYYYNELTGESSWTWPGGDEAAAATEEQYDHQDYSQALVPAAQSPQKQAQSSSQALQPKQRNLPIPLLPEVTTYSRDEGVKRQLALLTVQDRWQNLLVKTQFYLTEQRSLFQKTREDMFKKVTDRLESRLGVFVDDIKYMQRTLKKEMTDLNSTERDLRRLFDEENPNVIVAEKLSFILGGLEKLKTKAGSRYESAIKQIEKCGDDWNLIEAELFQMGNIFDESNAANLDQCRMACEHNAKVFAYDQAQNVVEVKTGEMTILRKDFRHLMLMGGESTHEAELGRDDSRNRQRNQLAKRAEKRAQLAKEMGNYPDAIESELQELGLEDIPLKLMIRDEEEILMGFLLTQIEMENSLASDYDSISEATRKIAKDLQEDILQYDAKQKVDIDPKSGSMFNKHRDTISRHGSALRVTLNKVKGKVKEGYALLNGRIEALDFDVERQAEEELAEGNTNA